MEELLSLSADHPQTLHASTLIKKKCPQAQTILIRAKGKIEQGLTTSSACIGKKRHSSRSIISLINKRKKSEVEYTCHPLGILTQALITRCIIDAELNGLLNPPNWKIGPKILAERDAID